MSGKSNIRALKRQNKKKRIRKKVSGTTARPRLVVFRSARNIYAQFIDDVQNRTIGGVSSITPDILNDVSKAKNKIEVAKIVGKAVADTAKKINVDSVVFDRGGYLYHGRVKALADSAREAGLKF